MRAAAAALRPPLRLWLRQASRALTPSPRMRVRLLIVLAAALLLGCVYVFWFRDSGFVRVEQVSITGARGAEAERMRVALTGAARDMTTLHVDRDRLERAVAGFSAVRTLEVAPDFPHSLRIRVVEHRPVAWAASDSGRVPVAADGSVLRGVPTGGALPTVRLTEPAGSDRIDDAAALRLLAVVGGAPPALAHRLTGVREKGSRGVVVQLRKGPLLIFGHTHRLEAKWLAAVRVLADPSSRGADYVDVRLPERPAAGGLPSGAEPEPAAPGPGLAPPAQGGSAPAPPSTPPATTPGATQPPQAAAPQATPQSQPTPGTAPTPPAAGTPAGGVPANPQP